MEEQEEKQGEKVEVVKTKKITSTKYKQVYPIILVNTKLGLLRIVNRNSTTSFIIKGHETKNEMDKYNKENGVEEWTPEHEVEMAVGSGFHRIHDTDNDRWKLWDAGKGERRIK